MKHKLTTFALAGAAAVTASAALAGNENDIYTLGEIHVTAPSEETSEIDAFGGSSISNKQNETFARNTLDKSVNLAPGVVSSNSGGTRNEQLIFVHGFDRWQVPLSIDGVRIYLPADNRLDFARFLTPDISEIQIAKGYVSVLDGPGGLGGAINLVSRKPTKPYEAEMRAMTEFGNGGYQGATTYARLGTRQENYYLQGSGTYRGIDGWYLPTSFAPTVNENGGMRDHSNTRDWNLNLKAGWTPNAGDEYSINFMKQSGAKGAPYHITDPINSQRYWDWPWWNVQNLSFLSNTRLGESSYVKTKLYWNTFDNALFSYDDAAQTIQNSSKSFRSIYQDWGAGGSVETGTDITAYDTIKAAFHYRRDSHTEWNENFTNAAGNLAGCTINVVCFTEPRQTTIEDTYSLALENTFHATRNLDIVGGASYDWRHLLQAEDFTSGAYVYYPLKDSQALNGQGAVIWRYSDTGKVFANVSNRTRFPTLFERFSSRFGGATSNPSLAPERATNYQLGWSNAFAPRSQISWSVFYSDVKDMIQSVPIVYNGSNVTQSQNVGNGYFYGSDMSLDYAVNDAFKIGGNLSMIRRVVTAPYIPNFQPTGVPELKSMAYVSWMPTAGLTLTPNIEFATKRWTSTTNGALYYQTGDYFLVNFQGEYKLTPQVTLSAGARNIFDQLYVLTDGFPEPGRTFYVAMKGVL
ncbi:MAG: TonB-dependent receptor [Xanthobacteraceae bacterium]|nr:MAG: TonB-dependent receptor [Xanthobacteraceae bacterium]